MKTIIFAKDFLVLLIVVLLIFVANLNYSGYTAPLTSFNRPLTDTFPEKIFEKNVEMSNGGNTSNIDLHPIDVGLKGTININNFTPTEKNVVQELSPEQVSNKTLERNPIILMWRRPWGNPFKAVDLNPKTCEANITCLFTSNGEMLEKAEAVLLHFTALNSVPKIRKHHQLYVYWSRENPTNTRYANHSIKNYINLTMTHRRDSDIYYPYSSLREILRIITEEKQPDLEGLLAQKSGKMAVWVVSNCGTTQRMDLAAGLEKNGVDVDRFGQCFNGPLGTDRLSKDFFDAISKYKFYFAFENTYRCKDYISGKFWSNSLRAGAVPVVYGAKKEDILKVAPLKSFIHFDDFESVKELAEYLKYLSSNETAYAEYLYWRKWAQNPNLIEAHLQEEMKINHLQGFCKLCELLHENRRNISLGNPRRWEVTSLQDYWFGQENKECLEMDKTKHL